MKKLSKWVPYLFAVVATIIAIGLSLRIRELHHEIRELQYVERTTITIPSHGVTRVSLQVRDAREVERAGWQARIEELESQIAELTADPVGRAKPEIEADVEIEPEKASLDDMRERLAGNKQVNAQLRALTGMAYADFFADADLEPELKNALRDVLHESQLEQVALARYAIEEGDITYSEHNGWAEDERALLASQVKELLSGEEYAAWEEYEGSIDERILEVTFQTQLRAFSSGLTPENHDLVLQVALEEFVAEQDALRISDKLFTTDESARYQIRAMGVMRERLVVLLPENQYGELDNWLTMGEEVMEDVLESGEN